ncbi:LLM class F420-dependent oxidoreductase [Promicromonospora sukumoe]|uniref:Putative F420-dependent oxidoreductase n=1 Tax=Promicromonospora sukumoe TaxID=88382 RepID=A0A7W3J855_9MICO|nr:TIGR03621 family F420-dependent LLM class oxidoreductase [Promicromonospora sukumoe]MBA8808021.1 putative F420-dependent oxidoreductase [Promicromonospora sukumoe]
MTASTPFRFGVVATPARTGTAWLDHARHVESLGFDTLVAPDSIAHGLSVLPLLAAAATVTTRLHLGTYVLANDFRHPVLVAKDAVTLAVLSDGRFELGIGAGHPGTGPDDAMIGRTFDRPGVRVSRLAESVDIIRRLLAGQAVTTTGEHYTTTDASVLPHGTDLPHVPLLIGAGGPRMLTLAAQHADTVALGIPLDADAPTATALVTLLHDAATTAGRDAPVELNINLMAVGDAVPRYLADRIDPAALAARGAVSVVSGSPQEMADQLRERRERLGVSYFVVSEELVDAFTPVLRLLSGE